jgi:sec-independent protein translocase protein TatB
VFGIGGSEILVILVIALLFLGPDKLPEAAKVISKTVRDLKKQGRILTQTIENDEHIGGAIRDLKSALRGDEIQVRPPPKKLAPATPTIAAPEDLVKIEAAESKATAEDVIAEANTEAKADAKAEAPVLVTLPPTAGEIDPEAPAATPADREDLAKLVKPAAGSVAREAKPAAEPVVAETPTPIVADADRKHG